MKWLHNKVQKIHFKTNSCGSAKSCKLTSARVACSFSSSKLRSIHPVVPVMKLLALADPHLPVMSNSLLTLPGELAWCPETLWPLLLQHSAQCCLPFCKEWEDEHAVAGVRGEESGCYTFKGGG